MKLICSDNVYRTQQVAPRVGVWIEIKLIKVYSSRNTVAPRVGVWIEIKEYLSFKTSGLVAPRVGVWIEIQLYLSKSCFLMSLLA